MESVPNGESTEVSEIREFSESNIAIVPVGSTELKLETPMVIRLNCYEIARRIHYLSKLAEGVVFESEVQLWAR